VLEFLNGYLQGDYVMRILYGFFFSCGFCMGISFWDLNGDFKWDFARGFLNG